MTVSRRLVAVFAADVEGQIRLMGDMPHSQCRTNGPVNLGGGAQHSDSLFDRHRRGTTDKKAAKP